MAVSVKKIVLWRAEMENTPGTLAGTLAPLAGAGANLQIVMGYRYTGEHGKAAVELYPVSGRKAAAAARAAGLAKSSIPTLLVEGDDKPGLGASMAQAIAGAGVNLAFLVAQVVGRKYSAVIGFDTEADARKAASLIKKIHGKPGRR